MRKPIVALFALFFLAGTAQAADCEAQAAEKKLAGAAKTSFLKKCNADAGASSAQGQCDAQAAEAVKSTNFLSESAQSLTWRANPAGNTERTISSKARCLRSCAASCKVARLEYSSAGLKR